MSKNDSFDPTDELIAIAEKTASALAAVNNSQIQNTFKAILDACNRAERAWSGSNIGYHANVYYRELDPPPPNDHFSPEWGLMDRFSNRSTHLWEACDPQSVYDQLLAEAGSLDVGAIAEQIDAARNTFIAMQENAISVLTAALSDIDDNFLQHKLGQLQSAAAPDVSTVIRNLLPEQYWTRDSQAMSQGLKAAPHQRLAAIPISGRSLFIAFEQVEKASRGAASHLHRLKNRSMKQSLVGTNVFLGHGRSPLWRELKDFLEKRLKLPVDEFNSVPVAGISTTARLSELLDAAAIALLVMSAEDEDADGKLNARLNVIHEVGLFQGRLGFARAIILLEEGCEEFSNIHGLGQIRFPSGNIAAIFEEIRAVLERENLI